MWQEIRDALCQLAEHQERQEIRNALRQLAEGQERQMVLLEEMVEQGKRRELAGWVRFFWTLNAVAIAALAFALTAYQVYGWTEKVSIEVWLALLLIPPMVSNLVLYWYQRRLRR